MSMAQALPGDSRDGKSPSSPLKDMFRARWCLNGKGVSPHEDSLMRCWRVAVKACGFDPKPTVHDLRHRWFTNAMRSGVPAYIADAILGHGNKKKSLQALYLNNSDEDLLAAIDMM